MSTDIMAAHDWPTNGHLIWDLVRLGYLHAEDYTLDTTYGRGVWWKLWQPKRLLTNGWTDDPSQPPTNPATAGSRRHGPHPPPRRPRGRAPHHRPQAAPRPRILTTTGHP